MSLINFIPCPMAASRRHVFAVCCRIQFNVDFEPSARVTQIEGPAIYYESIRAAVTMLSPQVSKFSAHFGSITFGSRPVRDFALQA